MLRTFVLLVLSPMAFARSADPHSEVFSVLSTDGTPLAIQVWCERSEPPTVFLHHHEVDTLPVTVDTRPGSPYSDAVRIIMGWGLDLDRPDHHGAVSYWGKNRGGGSCGTGCVESRFPVRFINDLKRNWTVHVRIETRDGGHVDAKIDLEGSGKRIETRCDGPALEDT